MPWMGKSSSNKKYALDGKIIKQQDISTVIRYVGGNINGRLLAWRFVQRNWAKLRKWLEMRQRNKFTKRKLAEGTIKQLNFYVIV